MSSFRRLCILFVRSGDQPIFDGIFLAKGEDVAKFVANNKLTLTINAATNDLMKYRP